jgi:hypothetical protein
VGTQVWRPQYIRDWIEKHAVLYQGRWHRKDNNKEQSASKGKGKTYQLKQTEQREAPENQQGYDPDWPDANA